MWFLTMPDNNRPIVLSSYPFTVGRGPTLSLILCSGTVSKLHAEIYETEDGLRVRDLGSTNGTFVNSARVTDAPIGEGDILCFAECKFRVTQGDWASDSFSSHGTALHRTIAVNWEGHTVGYVLNSQPKAETSMDWKRHGRWKPSVASPTFRAFMKRLGEAEETVDAGGRVRLSPAGASHELWFSLDHTRNEAWLHWCRGPEQDAREGGPDTCDTQILERQEPDN